MSRLEKVCDKRTQKRNKSNVRMKGRKMAGDCDVSLLCYRQTNLDHSGYI